MEPCRDYLEVLSCDPLFLLWHSRPALLCYAIQIRGRCVTWSILFTFPSPGPLFLVVLCIVPGNCQYWRKHIFGRSPILLIERPTTHSLCIIILLPLSLIQGIDHRLEEGWTRGAAAAHWLTKMCWPIHFRQLNLGLKLEKMDTK